MWFNWLCVVERNVWLNGMYVVEMNVYDWKKCVLLKGMCMDERNMCGWNILTGYMECVWLCGWMECMIKYKVRG